MREIWLKGHMRLQYNKLLKEHKSVNSCTIYYKTLVTVQSQNKTRKAESL